jgi:hypothetical protein
MLRRLLVIVWAAGITSVLAAALVWVIAASAASAQEPEDEEPSAQEPESKNCPAGFHWERMSGQCCVQDYETIPEHGRIGYTGNSICDDGYGAVYERRPTTDGQGPPGCPGYTSFVFLTECRLSDGAAAAGGGLGGGGAIRDLSDALYDAGSGPSAKDLAATGAITGGLLAGGLTGAILGSTFLGSSVPAVPSPQPSQDWSVRDRQILLEHISMLEKTIPQIIEERDKARHEWRAWGDLVYFYRWHYWTGQIPRWLAVGGISFLGAMGMPPGGLTGAWLWAGRAAQIGAAVAITDQNSSWPPSQDEAARMIEKLEPKMLEARDRYMRCDEMVRRLQESLQEKYQDLYRP